jgi:S-adenosylhomocysteine hydrolase
LQIFLYYIDNKLIKMDNSSITNTAKNPLLGGRGAISVIGAGTMGNGIAHVFAQSGFKVNLVDVNPSQLQST